LRSLRVRWGLCVHYVLWAFRRDYAPGARRRR
jgi:hypothetical protein